MKHQRQASDSERTNRHATDQYCSWGEAIRRHATRLGDAIALVTPQGETSWTQLDKLATRLGHLYLQRGIREEQLVAIGLPNGLDCIVAVLACWKVGATPLVLPKGLVSSELSAILQVATPALLVGDPEGLRDASHPTTVERILQPLEDSRSHPDAELPERVSTYCRATCSGGSTGIPKVIVDHTVTSCDPTAGMYTVPAGSVTLVPGPLSHSGPFLNSFWTLLGGGRLVLMERFDAEQTLQLIQTQKPAYLGLVPTMMLRIWRLPESLRNSFDISSLQRVVSSGAPCPPWLMRAWIEWLGPERMFEAYGASERVGGTLISGTEWLRHPGSVGKPTLGRKIRIVGPDGTEMPEGQIGQVYLHNGDDKATDSFHYLGTAPQRNEQGWVTLGDLGYTDAEGYLYLADRNTDMVVTGGVNVYPAEVEAAIEAWPGVLNAVVIGLPDEDLGQRLHAIIETADACTGENPALESFLEERLSRYKIPRSYEWVTEALRNEAGKVRRGALRAQRLTDVRKM